MLPATPDPLASFRAAVRAARARMDAPHTSYARLRNAQAEYHAAVDALRGAEWALDPAGCQQAHEAARDAYAQDELAHL